MSHDPSLIRDPEDYLSKACDLLHDVVHQFGITIVKDGQPCLSTGGLSVLEDAFEFLGMDDPYPLRIKQDSISST